MSSRLSRVVLVSPVPPPTGGIATWTLNLLAYWNELGSTENNFQLVHVSNARRFGTITERRKFFRVLAGIGNAFLFFYRFFRVTRFGKNQLLHITSSGSMGMLRDLILIVIFKVLGGQVITHIRFGRVPELLRRNNWEGILLRKVLIWSTEVISIDEPTFLELTAWKRCKVHYLPNAVSNLFLTQIDQVDKGDSNTTIPVILFVGHVTKAKGIFDLVEVCAELGTLKLKIAGIAKPADLAELNRLRTIYNSLEIEILGNINSEALIKELKECTIFCLPSYTEGFPNAVLEAMATGVAIVASRVGQIPKMVEVNEESAAWLFDAGNKPQLKKMLEEALNAPNERQKRGILCRQKVLSHYTADVVFGQLIDIWKKAV